MTNINKDISYLNLDNKIISILRDNSINKVFDLWILKRNDLKKIGLTDAMITQIIIKLELIGLDLGKKNNYHDEI